MVEASSVYKLTFAFIFCLILIAYYNLLVMLSQKTDHQDEELTTAFEIAKENSISVRKFLDGLRNDSVPQRL